MNISEEALEPAGKEPDNVAPIFIAATACLDVPAWFLPKGHTYAVPNAAWRNLTGVGEEEAATGGWATCVHPGERSAFMSQLADSLARCRSFVFRHRLSLASGGHSWAVTRGRPAIAPNGECAGLMGTTVLVPEPSTMSDETVRYALSSARASAWNWDTEADVLVEVAGSDYFLSHGMKSADLISEVVPEDAQRVGAWLEEVRRGNNPGDLRYRIREREGTVREYVNRGEFLVEGSVKTRKFCCTSFDVTGLDQALSAIGSDDFYKTLGDAVPNFLWAADANGRIFYINSRWEEFSGKSLEECLADDWASVHHPDDFEQIMADWAQTYKSKLPYESQQRLKGKDGNYRRFLIRGAPLFDAEGNVRMWVGTSTDIHDHWLSERQRIEQAQQLAAVFGQAAAGIAMLDPDGKVKMMNRRYGEILRREPDDLIGTRLHVHLHADDQADAASRLEATVGRHQRTIGERRYRRSDGSMVWVNESLSPILDEGGRTTGVIAVAHDVLDRKIIESQLQKSQDRVEMILEAAKLGFFYCELPFDTLVWDVRCKQHFGMPPDSRVSMHDFVSRLHPDDREPTMKAIDRAIYEHGIMDVDYRTIGDDGITRIVRAVGKCFYDDDGQPVQFDGITLDVTEKRRAQQQLQETQERLDAFYRSDVIGLVLGDIHGRVQDANEEFLRIIGYSREDLEQGRIGWAQITPPEHLESDQAGIAEAMRKGVCRPYEKEYIRKNGDRVPVLLGFVLTGDPPEHSVAFVLDQTEQKRAERSLKESESRFRMLSETLPAMVWMTDLVGNQIYNNHYFAEFTGVSRHNLMGEGWLATIHPDDRLKVRDAWKRSVEAEEDFAITCRIRRHDGQSRWFSTSAHLMRDSNGSPVRWLGVSTDVDDGKRTEERLTEMNESLERILAHRTRALIDYQEQLRRSERLASIGTLAAGIAHEINNPLNTILMAADYALNFGCVEEAREALKTVCEEATRGGEIVRNILKFSREDESEKAPADLNEVIQRAADLGKLYARNDGLIVELHLDPNLPLVPMNTTEIEQVVVNLVKNASEASDAKPRVTISTRLVGDSVEFEVKDDGPGIPDDALPHVFDPFFSTKRHSGGTGLGLSVTHGIVMAHRGTISVRSRLGQCTVFTIHLPITTEL